MRTFTLRALASLLLPALASLAPAQTTCTNPNGCQAASAPHNSGDYTLDLIAAPAANVSWAVGNRTITSTFGAATGASNLFTVQDTANNTGTGYVMVVGTAAGSTANPFQVLAKGGNALNVQPTGQVCLGTGACAAGYQLHLNNNNTTDMTIRLGDANGATQLGNAGSTGDAFLNAETSNTNLLFKLNSVEYGRFDGSTKAFRLSKITLPGSNPPAGTFYVFMDTADNKLKALGPSGTLTVLAVP